MPSRGFDDPRLEGADIYPNVFVCPEYRAETCRSTKTECPYERPRQITVLRGLWRVGQYASADRLGCESRRAVGEPRLLDG